MKVESLPYSIPENWINPKEAKILGYKYEPNTKKTLSYIDTNESMFNYSTSNIQNLVLLNVWGLRLEGFFLRVRMVVYITMITTLTMFPLICSATILLLELLHVSFYIYYALRYRYVKNWILVISKVNTGVAIIILSGMATLLNVYYKDSTNPFNKISLVTQYICIVYIIVSSVLEVLLIVVDTGIRIF